MISVWLLVLDWLQKKRVEENVEGGRIEREEDGVVWRSQKAFSGS
jgi:hypothetical protein